MASQDDESTFNLDALVAQINADPKLHAALLDVAREYGAVVRQTWPKSIGDQTTRQTRKQSVFEIVPSHLRGKRPWVHFNVNHPWALAHQARTGAFTKAAASLGLKVISDGR